MELYRYLLLFKNDNQFCFLGFNTLNAARNYYLDNAILEYQLYRFVEGEFKKK